MRCSTPLVFPGLRGTIFHAIAGGIVLTIGLLTVGCASRSETASVATRPSLPAKRADTDEPDRNFASARQVMADDLKVERGVRVIGAGDLILISLWDVNPGEDVGKKLRVSETGYIVVPLLGQVRAAGLTEHQLEMEINEGYREAR